jgi:CRISPR-associated endonuclease/helicase Cas3
VLQELQRERWIMSNMTDAAIDKFIAHLRQSDGKPQLLMDHLHETSGLAAAFASKIGLEDHGRLIGLLHDLGKASDEFDSYIRSAVCLIDPEEDDYVDATGKKGKVDHSSAGAHVLYRLLSAQGPEGAIAAQVLALPVASHHSGMIDCISPDGKNNYQRRMDKAEEKTHTDEAFNRLPESERNRIKNLVEGDLVKKLVEKIRAMKEECDSTETVMFKVGLLTRFLLSCLVDADRLNTADFEQPKRGKMRNHGKYVSWDTLIERFDALKFTKSNRIDDLRETVSRRCHDASRKSKGVFQLAVPTGGGKTLSSLRFGLHHAEYHDLDRIVYVIPYTSIIDQNAEAVRAVLGDPDRNRWDSDGIVLEHHSNLTPENETIRQSILSENWDAPIVFTTSVQFLEALFGSGTRNVRRMHQLANSVIIFDEIQTIPIQTVHMFNVALRFLTSICGSTAVLCTATQPLLDKIEPKSRALPVSPDRKIISDTKRLFRELRRVDIHDLRRKGGWQETDVAELVLREVRTAQDGGENASVLTIVNTKASARSLYSELNENEHVGVYHLSTDMCAQHRLDILATIKRRLAQDIPTICVSTQLIEAGVDIDFGSVIRYLAGLDSIAQAAGRCNRNGNRDRGNVYVVNPTGEHLGRLEEIKVGADITNRILDEFRNDPERIDGDLLSPAAMDRFYEYYFYNRKDKMNYPVTATSIIQREDDLFSLLSTNPLSVRAAEQAEGKASTLFLRQSFKAASRIFQSIDTQTRGVIVPYMVEGERIVNELCGAFNVEQQFRLLKRAQRYSINLYENAFRTLIDSQIIREVQKDTGVYYLDKQYYSSDFGLSREVANGMEPLVV